MAKRYSREMTGVLDGSKPASMADGRIIMAKLKRIRATVDLASATFANGDTIALGRLPAGASFAYGVLNASATMGASATLAIGTAAAAGKYRAAATFTAAAPTLFGVVAASAAAPLDAEEEVIATIGAANLPSSGTLEIDIFYSDAA